MNKISLQNIESAEKATGTRLPDKLRDFMCSLYEQEIEFGDTTWIFSTVKETYPVYENPIVNATKGFRENWDHIPVVLFANDGCGDYLAVWPSRHQEQIFRLNYGSELEFYANDIYAAYNGHFNPANVDDYCKYAMNDEGKVEKIGILSIIQNFEAAEHTYVDEYLRKKSIVDDMIDNEETDKCQQILDILNELIQQPDYAPWAWYKLSDLNLKGFGPLAVNIELALDYNLRAVELGHNPSLANRAWCYCAGIGVEKDIEKAYELIKKANGNTMREGEKEKDGLYYEMLLKIKSEYVKRKNKK